MLVGELMAAVKALTGAGKGFVRGNLATAAVVDADCIGCARLRNARGTADIARTSACCALSAASATTSATPGSTGFSPSVGGTSGVRVVAAAEALA